MDLSEAQKRALYERGFVTLPAVVGDQLVGRALRAINASLGTRGMHPDELPTLRAQTYCPELRGDPAITGLLYDSPLWSLAESAIGPGRIQHVPAGQIALRFPSMAEPDSPHPHLDGMYTPTNGVPEGTIMSFTALVGVFLSDLPRDSMGNLSVWPGTHRLYEEYFRRHGPQSLLEGLPPVALPEPEQITGRAGDAILCHYQLAHGVAGNGSPYVRYAVFFRLERVDHHAQRWECMTNIWREWDGMRGIAAQGR